jgi:tRNA-2-methylthio-N6-dimethylallyladenosine synthase
MNHSDSERITSVLEKIGYKKSPDINEADLIVVNMCSVRQSAVDRVYGLLDKFEKLKTKNSKLTLRRAQGDGERSRTIKTILTGCILKADRKKFADRFDLILDIKDLSKLPKILHTKYSILHAKDYLKIKPKHKNSFSAFVPIMTGCNNFCSYCVVPYTRGREISRSAKEILVEIKNLVKKRTNPIRNAISNGAREIWLLGQNVNSYKSRINTNRNSRDINFAKLLKMVNEISGNFWIRFTSPHPKDFSDELINTMTKCQKVTEYLNLPVQSGDDEILKRMNRPYTIKKYKEIVRKIREKIPGTSLSTDIIVGFPEETKKQFENTVKLFEEIKYDMAYIAKYSPRSGTVAAKLKDNVSPDEKERRYKILTKILKETALGKNKKYIGKEVEVLVESRKSNVEGGNYTFFGKTRTYKTVKLQTTNYKLQTNLFGQFVKVKIIDALPWGLRGKLV